MMASAPTRLPQRRAAFVRACCVAARTCRAGSRRFSVYYRPAMTVPNDSIRRHAERLVSGPVDRNALVLAFRKAVPRRRRCSSAGRLLPAHARGHPGRLILGAHQPVRISARSDRRRVRRRTRFESVGRRSCSTRGRPETDLIRTDPRGRSTSTSLPPASRCASHVPRLRATARGRWELAGRLRWNLGALGHVDHRKVVVVDGRIGWVGGAGNRGSLRGWSVPRPVRSCHRSTWSRNSGSCFSPAFAGLAVPFPSPRSSPSSPRSRMARTPAVVLHNAPGSAGRSPTRSRDCSSASGTLDVVNPYVTDRGMIRRIEDAARRGVRVRLFVPANANNWACAGAQRFHHGTLLDAGVRILEYPAMLHAKAFVRDGEVVAGTCNLEAWSLKRFFEIDLQIRSGAVAMPSSTSGSARRPRRCRLPVDGSPGPRSARARCSPRSLHCFDDAAPPRSMREIHLSFGRQRSIPVPRLARGCAEYAERKTHSQADPTRGDVTEVATQTSVLTGLEPSAFWGHFEALTRIPAPVARRGAGDRARSGVGGQHGFELEQDAGRNLVIRVPATPGRESAPTVTLQGHLDMVCGRDPSSPNDPAEGRIALVRDGEWLTADGTTLGADDGVAIAAMMALVEDESLPHGPLELLMTVAGGSRARRCERARPGARHGLDPRQPRQRGGRPADGRLRRQHGHVGADRRAARGCRARRHNVVHHGRGWAGRALRIGHRTGQIECGQGPRVVRCARRTRRLPSASSR